MQYTGWLDRSRFTGLDPSRGDRFPFSVSMLSWAYNEEEGIEEFLQRSQRFMDALGVDYEHVLIDDGSTDRTAEIIAACAPRYPQLRVIRNPSNLDCGWNTRIAVFAARKDVIFWQTADWGFDISRLGQYLWHLRDYDVVQGCRTNPPLKRSDTVYKGFISLCNYALVRLLFRVPVGDYQNVTIYPRALAQSIRAEASSAFSNPEYLIKAHWLGARIKEVPIDTMKRRKGVAKGSRPLSILRSLGQVLYFWAKWTLRGHRFLKDDAQVVVEAHPPAHETQSPRYSGRAQGMGR